VTSNSPFNIVDPQIQLFWEGLITQPLLAGFGFGTNERWIRIAKRNLQITDYAFKAQVIATVTGVEDIYWDLVNAYEDEQIKERGHPRHAGHDRPVRRCHRRGQPYRFACESARR
jgi:hypothetical protein